MNFYNMDRLWDEFSDWFWDKYGKEPQETDDKELQRIYQLWLNGWIG